MFKLQNKTIYNTTNFKEIKEPILKEEHWYKTIVLPLIIISVFEVRRNDAIAKNMVLDYYDNNPESNYNKKNF